MHLADMTILDGVVGDSGRAHDVEVNFYEDDDGKLSVFEFSSRDGAGKSIILPISQIDNLLDMLNKIKSKQSA